MSCDRHALGAEGELRAALYLRSQGYRITGHNVRSGGVEIDLVAERGNLLVFVEVKTRRSARFGAPECAVDRRKRARLVRGAASWLRENRRRRARVRFDVISCYLRASAGEAVPAWEIRHLEGAFDANA